jgi:hypothetical protein
MRWLSDAIRGKKDESELSSGMLYSTGLVAGGSIAGLTIAILSSGDWSKGFLEKVGIGHTWNVLGIFGEHGQWSALFVYALLCFVLVRKSLKKLEL